MATGKRDVINFYFSLFHLDDRASQRELEIAFDTLTKEVIHTDIKRYKAYRLAFEYLMNEVYCNCDGISTMMKRDGVKLSHDQIILDNLPEEVEECFSDSNLEELDSVLSRSEDITFDEKAKAFFATQIISLPLLLNSFCNNMKSWLGFNFCTLKDVSKIIKEACINPLQYDTLCFELCPAPTKSIIVDLRKQQEIVYFLKAIKEMYFKDKMVCPKFKIKKTLTGAMCLCTFDADTCEVIRNLITSKAKQSDYYLNMNINAENY